MLIVSRTAKLSRDILRDGFAWRGSRGPESWCGGGSDGGDGGSDGGCDGGDGGGDGGGDANGGDASGGGDGGLVVVVKWLW